MPLVRPLMVQVSAVVAQVAPFGLAVTTYPVMFVPPDEAGADHEMVAEPLSLMATTLFGASGVVKGVTAVELAEGALEPTAVVATTEKV